jgi:hypothetical protein
MIFKLPFVDIHNTYISHYSYQNLRGAHTPNYESRWEQKA